MGCALGGAESGRDLTLEQSAVCAVAEQRRRSILKNIRPGSKVRSVLAAVYDDPAAEEVEAAIKVQAFARSLLARRSLFRQLEFVIWHAAHKTRSALETSLNVALLSAIMLLLCIVSVIGEPSRRHAVVAPRLTHLSQF